MYSFTVPEAFKNPIAALFKEDKEAWRDRFFPEYAGLPMHGRKVYYNPATTNKGISTVATVPELAPWDHVPAWGGMDPRGVDVITEIFINRGGKEVSKSHYSKVEPADYQAKCDTMNFYRNGGVSVWNGQPGLDVAVFFGGAWDIRWGKYWRDRGKKDHRQPIVCGGGTYFPTMHNGRGRPWGINAFFFPLGRRVPSYISDRYGPNYTQSSGISYWGGRYELNPFGPIPTQDEYNEKHWKRCLPWL